MTKNNDIDFIARHYRHKAFSSKDGWQNLGILTLPRWKRYKIAAAIAVTLAIGATATILITGNYRSTTDSPTATSTQTEQVTPCSTAKAIDFDNASLSTVLAEIKTVYGIELVNLPTDDKADTYSLSLHYEGDAENLIRTINEILGTEMKIAD